MQQQTAEQKLDLIRAMMTPLDNGSGCNIFDSVITETSNPFCDICPFCVGDVCILISILNDGSENKSKHYPPVSSGRFILPVNDIMMLMTESVIKNELSHSFTSDGYIDGYTHFGKERILRKIKNIADNLPNPNNRNDKSQPISKGRFADIDLV